ncbi:hypothetical protein NFI96_029396, partial [Prochilodus magdalenae]
KLAPLRKKKRICSLLENPLPFEESEHDRMQISHVRGSQALVGETNESKACGREPAVTRTVKKWSKETEEALKDCFESTVWEELSDPNGEDIDSLTHCITDYVDFCVENTVPTKTIRCFSNNKPWINPDIKAPLKEKKRVFRSGDQDELKAVQRELRRKIREGKASYRRKLEEQLQRNNVRSLESSNPFTPSTQPPCSSLSFTTAQVRNELRKIKAKKAAGPDGISARLLKSCADQLCRVVEHMFSMSLKLGRVPQLWKTSCVVPVPKTQHPKDLNSYRPVALTSHLMKSLERLVLTHLRPLVRPSMDPLQFAYQPGVGVDDAVIYLLHRALFHLEKPGSTVRITFFDFSSAFNTIQPGLLQPEGQAGTCWCGKAPFKLDTGLPHQPNTNHLQINAGKTKELMVDFRRCRHPPPLVNIRGMDIERVDSYKYLGVHLNNKLDWSVNTTALYIKGQRRLYLLRRLRSFGVLTPEDLLRYSGGICHLLQSGLLVQQHLDCRQEETGQTVKEGRLCPGKPLRPSGGGGRQED